MLIIKTVNDDEIMMTALTDDSEYESEGGGGGAESADDVMNTEPITPARWKQVEETFQGCISDTASFNLTGGVMYVNLAQVSICLVGN